MAFSSFIPSRLGSASSREVTFTTKDGRVVSFTPSPRVPTREPGAYALYVKRHIRAFLDQGLSAPEAMIAVAKKYRKDRRG